MNKKVVILFEASQNKNVYKHLVLFAKQKFPGWAVDVLTISNQADSDTPSDIYINEKQPVESISFLHSLVSILGSADLVIGRSSPAIDEIISYLAAKTGSVTINKCMDVVFDSTLSVFSVCKNICGSRINADIDIKAGNTAFVSLENIVIESSDCADVSADNYYSVGTDVLYGKNYASSYDVTLEKKGIDISDASIVIAGGRGIKSKEDFELLKVLADKLGGAVGATRALVDEDFIGEESQVGQTGKTVHPDFYIAFGVSGATQHLAGMRGSKTIIAVNKDAEAPIFQFSDYGVVHDYKEIILNLIERLTPT